MNRFKREEARKRWGPSCKIPGSYLQTFEHAVTVGNLTLAQELIKAGAFWASGEVGLFHSLNQELNSIFERALREDNPDMVRWILEQPNIKLSIGYKIYCLVKSLAQDCPRGQAWSLLAEQVDLKSMSPGYFSSYDITSAIELLISSECKTAVRYMIAVLLKNPEVAKYLRANRCGFCQVIKTAIRRGWLNTARGLAKLSGNDLGDLTANMIQDASAEMIIMLYRRGWRPVRAKSPKILEALAEKLEQAGWFDEGQDLRERSCKIIAKRVAKELERN